MRQALIWPDMRSGLTFELDVDEHEVTVVSTPSGKELTSYGLQGTDYLDFAASIDAYVYDLLGE